MKTALNLESIYGPIQGQLPQAEEKILHILATTNELSSEVIRYFFKAKGKFLRPALCLFGASFGNPAGDKAVQMAAALEIFHSATLIHDDIIDSAYLRRNLPTINAAWNSQVAVLVGDFLHDKAIGAVFSLNHPKVINSFLETAGIVCDGEILELSEKGNFDLTEQKYLTIIEKKTASLLACCLETGALLSGVSEPQAQALKRYGILFGNAFQIIDDCLDFAGEENEFGKTLGSDLAQGVLTLPLIRLISLVDAPTKANIIELLKDEKRPNRLQQLLEWLNQYEALDYSYQRAKELTDLARLELSVFHDHPAKKSLNLLLDYILERNR